MFAGFYLIFSIHTVMDYVVGLERNNDKCVWDAVVSSLPFCWQRVLICINITTLRKTINC